MLLASIRIGKVLFFDVFDGVSGVCLSLSENNCHKNLLDHALTAEGSEVFLLRFSPIFTG